ncbi:hypothetical protein IT409_02310, partial [Candidatus Falkowbacteria bacterium]|nr:hypothetical protein [Candidatus Falkowbacteria bacterium]
MIGMFHKMMHQEVYFAYIIPPNLRHWGDSISFISDHRVQYMFLGTGDIIMPMLILTHTFFISKVMTLWILAGASLALVGMYLILVKSKYQKALPALPFIALGMLTGFLVHLLLS